MPSILALATAQNQYHSGKQLASPPTIGTVEKQDGVGAAKNWDQSQVHFGGVCLLGVRNFILNASMVAALAALRRDTGYAFLVAVHTGVDALFNCRN